MPSRVVVIHPGSLGDVLLAVPALRQLRKRFPHGRLLLVSAEAVGRLLLDLLLIDHWISIHGSAWTELFAGVIPPQSELRAWLEDCEVAVAWIEDEDGTVATALAGTGVHEVIVRSPFNKGVKAVHQSDRFLEIINETGWDPIQDEKVLIPPGLARQGRSYLEGLGIPTDRSLVLLHPGSGSRHKCVKPEIVASVVEDLLSRGIQVLVLEGPADKEAVADLVKLVRVRPPVARGLDVSSIAGLLAHAHLYLGHDSGLTHLAGLLGGRTVILFGPTDPARWAPRGSYVTVMRGGSCQCHSWEQVIGCLEKSCLAFSSREIVKTCGALIGLGDTNPRNLSQCALFHQDPCDTVPR